MKNKLNKTIKILAVFLMIFTSIGLSPKTEVKALAGISGEQILQASKKYDSWGYWDVGTCTGFVTRTLDDLGIADSVVGSMVGTSARYSPDQMLANAKANPQDAKVIYEGLAKGAYGAGVKNGDLVIATASDMGTSFGHVGFVEIRGGVIGWYGANNETTNVGWQAFDSTRSTRGIDPGGKYDKVIHVFRLGEDIKPLYASLSATKNATETVNVSLSKTDVDTGKVLSDAEFDFYRDNVKFATAKTNANGVATATFTKTYSATSGTKTFCTNYDQLDANGKQQVANAGAFAYQHQAQASADTEAQNSANAMANKPHQYMAIETVTKTKYWLNPNNDTTTGSITGSGNVNMALTNKRVIATLNIIKNDSENGTTTPQGDATLDGAVYGLYARENILDPADNSVLYKTNALVHTFTTKDAKASVSSLYLGKYYLKEIKAPTGYNLDTKEYDVDLAFEGQNKNVVVKTAILPENVITGDFDLEKIITNAQNSEIVTKEEGAEFIVVLKKYVTKYGSIEKAYEHRSEYTEKEFDKLITDKNGYDKTNPLAYGTYVIKQIKGQVDTESLNETWEFKVEKENQETIRYIVNNRPFTSYIKLVKLDAETGKTVVLDNATFKVFDKKANKYLSQKVGETHIKEFTTNDKGYVVLPLEVASGEYRLDEIRTPEGYLINKDGVDFKVTNSIVGEVDGDRDPIQVVRLSDVPVKGKITIEKTGEVLTSVKTDRLGNVHFKYETQGIAGMKVNVVAESDILDPADGSVIYSAGHIVETVTTGKNGKVVTSELPLGNYYVQEVSAPDGFVLNGEKHSATLTYKDDVTAIVTDSVSIHNERQKVDVSTIKKDFDTETLLSGALFGTYNVEPIYSVDGTLLLDANTLLEKATSDDLGKAQFIADYPLVKLEVRELRAPIGYSSSNEVLEYDATYKGQDIEVVEIQKEFKNKITKVEISKTDITTDKELPNAQLMIFEKENKGNVFATWVSGETPELIKGLEVGKTYVLRETSSPYGFAIAKDVEFSVLDTGEIQKVKMEDDLTMGKLSWTKKGEIFLTTDTGMTNVGLVNMPVWEDANVLGAEITIYAEENITLGNDITYYTKDEKIEVLESDLEAVTSKLLPVGKYYYKETKAPIGHVIDNKKHCFEIEDTQSNDVQVVESVLNNKRPTYDFDFTKELEFAKTVAPDAYKDVIFGFFTRDDTYDYFGNVAIEPDTLVSTTGIDKDGKLTSLPDLPVGNYYMKELQTNEAYHLDTEEYDFTVSQSQSEENTITINKGENVINRLKEYYMLINKVDSETDKNIKGKDFEFTTFLDANCTKALETKNADTEDGTVRFDLNHGTTYIKETRAPKGYALSPEVVKVEATDKGLFVNGKRVTQDEDLLYSIVYKNSLIPAISTGDNTDVTGLSILLSGSVLAFIGIALKKRKDSKRVS